MRGNLHSMSRQPLVTFTSGGQYVESGFLVPGLGVIESLLGHNGHEQIVTTKNHINAQAHTPQACQASRPRISFPSSLAWLDTLLLLLLLRPSPVVVATLTAIERAQHGGDGFAKEPVAVTIKLLESH